MIYRSCLAAISVVWAGLAPAAAQTAPAPKLIVAISVDQFSADLFSQYRGRFGAGLKKLIDGGAVFPNGYQSHAATETCPGHATILSGRRPGATGIIANSWYGADGKEVYCVYDKGMVVPGRPDKPRGPANLKTTMLGDWLKVRDAGSRTVSVSGKDRAAIVMAGQNPTATFWWDDDLGFNTAVKPGGDEVAALAPVAGFNAALDSAWTKALPSWKPLDPRCTALDESRTYAPSLRIDHHVPPVLTRDSAKSWREDKAFLGWLRASPLLDKITLDLAGDMLERYKLGQLETTDVLAVSLSATDHIGHRYGNQGPEMCDQMAHLDRALGAFLARIDRLKIPYAVVLTADHGAVDAAERVADRGVPTGRVMLNLPAALNAMLRSRLSLDFDPILGADKGAYENQSLYIDRRKADAGMVRKIVAETLTLLGTEGNPALPWNGMIVGAFPRDEIVRIAVPAGKPADELSLAERYAESVDAERSPDIFVAFAPAVSFGGARAGGAIAGHGSPWNHDRRVPILFWRSGGKPFEQSLPIRTIDIAPTLAAIVGMKTRHAEEPATGAADNRPVVDGQCRDIDPGPANSCR
ncbi:alkaline phosphatase family protein [Sphingobium fluviale]|uniref:Alkaline phosphatase n=1 Tax=Sphingobium fluviale TaxID=2506423 RepID=A0A4Q1KKJ0_9SPHN|nr:alkaline phosphatase family protein [Sphingobium fluviale]RXR29925.1 alkaline phosphatase family protein [Sphingobium fluviale]